MDTTPRKLFKRPSGPPGSHGKFKNAQTFRNPLNPKSIPIYPCLGSRAGVILDTFIFEDTPSICPDTQIFEFRHPNRSQTQRSPLESENRVDISALVAPVPTMEDGVLVALEASDCN